jgi:3,4-dihydroxy 2-butanone 4-phosphate synthase/GTP cyclohydrolase II
LVNNDIIGTLINNPDDKLGKMFDVVNNEKKGALVFINQEYNTYDLIQRLKELKKHQETQEGNLHVKKMDDKDFGIGAQILHNLNIHKIKLISNNDSAKKRVGMVGYGLEIVDHISY